MAKQIEVGARVAYSVQFLKSIFSSHSDMAHARGTVTALVPLGSSTVLAEITWDKGEFPARVNTCNLAIVGANSKFAQY